MRTVFAKILLLSFGTLVLSLGAYLFISARLASRISGKGGPFERTVAFQVDEAEVTYRSGGPAALGAYLRKLQAYFGPEHFLTDAQGKDLVTGADRSALLAAARGEYNVPHPLGGRFVLVAASQDGAYRLIATGRPPALHALEFSALLWTDFAGRGAAVLDAGRQHRFAVARAGAHRGALRPRRFLRARSLAQAR